MGESFVDVSYRGMELGRRLKLRDVRPDSGYLEIPLPMPVGTTIEIVADDGVRFAARVAAVHEQVGGSDQTPGMKVRPALDGAAAAWWAARVDTAAEPGAPPVASAPAAAPEPAVATPAQAAVAPNPAEPSAPEPVVAAASGRATVVMSTEAVQAALAAADADEAIPEGLVDDGKRTTVMTAIDISMITGEAPAEVGAAGAGEDEAEITIEAEDGDGDSGDGEVSGELPATASGATRTNGKSKASRSASGKRKRRGKKSS